MVRTWGGGHRGGDREAGMQGMCDGEAGPVGTRSAKHASEL